MSQEPKILTRHRIDRQEDIFCESQRIVTSNEMWIFRDALY